MQEINVWFWGNQHSTDELISESIVPEEKIRIAYNKYGENLFANMDYAFAVIIQDTKHNKWILARDRFGIEPLYFKAEGGNTIQFSQLLPDLRDRSARINYNNIGEYLSVNTTSYGRYTTATFYEEIQTVLPAHYIVFQNGKFTSKPYWKPKIVDFRALSRIDYFEDFRSLLIDSIEKNTANYKNVGAHLSGGMDSSSLAILYAQKKPLHTFFFDGSLNNNRDQYYASLVAERYSLIHHHNLNPSNDIYECLYSLSLRSGFPERFILPTSLHMPASVLAQQLGCDAIITGHDGDTIVGHGRNHVGCLFKSKDWSALKQALEVTALGLEQWGRDWDRLDVESKKNKFKNFYINRSIIQKIKQRDLKQAAYVMRKARKEIGYIPTSLVSHLTTSIIQRLKYPFDSSTSLLRPEFSTETSFAGLTSDELYDIPKFDNFEQFEGGTNRDFVYINEEFFSLGQMHGHRYLFPFFDRRLFELSLSVPDAVKFGDGKTRALLREGLKNDLPRELLERKGKTEFSDYLLRACENLWKSNQDRFMENTDLWEIVDQKFFLQNMDILLNKKRPEGQRRAVAYRLNKVMFLGVWLETLKSH